MNQPELGKKISKSKLAKGLTQSELAEKCNLSSGTIQRIESRVVVPRSYMVKLIFSSLDYEVYNSFGSLSYPIGRGVTGFFRALSFWGNNVRDLFNKKTKTMKKISILSVILFLLLFSLTSLFSETNAKSKAKVQKVIEATNKNYVRWFNNG